MNCPDIAGQLTVAGVQRQVEICYKAYLFHHEPNPPTPVKQLFLKLAKTPVEQRTTEASQTLPLWMQCLPCGEALDYSRDAKRMIKGVFICVVCQRKFELYTGAEPMKEWVVQAETEFAARRQRGL